VTTTAELQTHFLARPVLGVNVAVSNYDELVQNTLLWARERHSRALFFAAVHMVMEAADNPAFLGRLNDADVVFPDGMPLVWALRALGQRRARRVCGPDAMAVVLAAAEKARISVGFYGGSQATLDSLVAAVSMRHPDLGIVFHESPPFRALTPEEDLAVVNRIAASGAQLLFVGLGCPKQENWVMEHMGRVPAVMFAVGAAFDRQQTPCSPMDATQRAGMGISLCSGAAATGHALPQTQSPFHHQVPSATPCGAVTPVQRILPFYVFSLCVSYVNP
jgi:N-acetylglucosaminyldiphosphoundecaprenol N-acetyl-beta-D-mannosaminyltransferase